MNRIEYCWLMTNLLKCLEGGKLQIRIKQYTKNLHRNIGCGNILIFCFFVSNSKIYTYNIYESKNRNILLSKQINLQFEKKMK